MIKESSGFAKNENNAEEFKKSVNPVELAVVIEEFLQESSRYNVDCLDLKDDVIKIVLDWFEENKEELSENFKDLHPQTFPLKQKLLDSIRPVLSLDRIHVESVGLEFRRTKIVDNWVGEIYDKLLKRVFKGK